MFCYAELGSRFPEAGGDYALASRSLGRRVGSVYTVLFAIKGISIPALLALSTAAYLHQLWMAFPIPLGGILLFGVFIALASTDIRTSGAIVSIMVTIELIVLVVFVSVSATHLRQPPAALWHIGTHSWMSAITAALYGLNGPQACLYYSFPCRFGGAPQHENRGPLSNPSWRSREEIVRSMVLRGRAIV
jgi:amino acid transporter